MLATMTCPLALGFLVYHIYLIWAGTTTNETAKWTDLREDILDGLVWKAKIKDVSSEYPGPLDNRIVYDAEYYRDQMKMNGQRPEWPRREEWWLIRTRGGAQPMRLVQRKQAYGSNGTDANMQAFRGGGSDGNDLVEVVDERWLRVRDLKEVDNIYDLGVVGNLRDATVRGFKG